MRQGESISVCGLGCIAYRHEVSVELFGEHALLLFFEDPEDGACGNPCVHVAAAVQRVEHLKHTDRRMI